MSRRFASFLLCAALSPAHGAALPDPDFGAGGHVFEGFQATASGEDSDSDAPGVACAGPDGSLVVSGLASGGARVVTMWRDEQGALDPAFSLDGKESFVLPRPARTLAGLCHPDGSLLLATALYAAGGEADLVLLKLSPHTGLPDPAFAGDGVLELDLDALTAQTGAAEVPLQLNLGGGGDLLLSGYYHAAGGGNAGMVLRIGAAGSLLAAHLAAGATFPVERYAGAAPAGDGTLWAVAGFDRRTTVQRLHAATLAPVDAYLDNGHPESAPQRAVAAAGGLAVAAAQTDGTPLVLHFPQPGLARALRLPRLAATQHTSFGQVAALGPQDLFYVGAIDDGSRYLGAQVARVRIGAGGELVLHTRVPPRRYAPPAPAACPGHVSHALPVRFTYWRGRPTLAGSADRACPGERNFEYWVLRLREPGLFGDGFD